MRFLPAPEAARRFTTDELRAHFLVSGLFVPGAITLSHIDLDRVVIGAAVPLDVPLALEPFPALRAATFCERRELGVLNTGGAGTVVVDGTTYALDAHDVLYVGRGATSVQFASASAATPARFYLVSYPAHTTHPTALIKPHETDNLELGTAEQANRRTVRRYIHANGVQSCQLVMGVTTLAPGSVWNTMPAHTHDRRTEVYLYFGLPANAMVVHLVGEPTETRSLIVRDSEVALSPGWSVHTGCGTQAYAFCWAMGGENQDYADMDAVSMETIR
jgi:4-deoxy-L-threo-5-hexosulose-uronate ketol-isomerase